MKLLVIGNSHVGAIKWGWDAKRRTGVEMDFFAVPGGGGPWYRFENGLLVVYVPPGRSMFTTIEGADAGGTDISAYDAILFSAVGFFPASNDYLTHATEPHPLGVVRCADWPTNAPDPRYPVSRAVFDEVIEDALREAHTVKSCLVVAAGAHRPVYVQPIPPPSLALCSDPNWKMVQWNGSGVQPWGEAFFSAQMKGLRKIAAGSGFDMRVLDYPDPLQIGAGFLDPSFSVNEGWHGNAAYGECVMEAFLDACAAGAIEPAQEAIPA